MEAHAELPLKLVIREPSMARQLPFATAAAVIAQRIGGVSAQATDDGLVLRALTEQGLEEAIVAVSSIFPSAVPGRPEVVYLTEPELLEPYVRVAVVSVADECLGDVLLDLSHRRALIERMLPGDTGKRIEAEVPLVEMFGYKATLGSLSRGRASFMLSFSRYVPVHPPDLPPAMRA
jgi:hypothetical protein